VRSARNGESVPGALIYCGVPALEFVWARISASENYPPSFFFLAGQASPSWDFNWIRMLDGRDIKLGTPNLWDIMGGINRRVTVL